MKLLLSFILFIQVSVSIGQIAKIDPCNPEELVIDDSEKNKILSITMNEFSILSKTNSGSSIGNYVGFSTADKTLKFNYSWMRDWGILEINTSGGATDGVLNVIGDQKLNTDVQIGVNYKRIITLNELGFQPAKIDRKKNEYITARNTFLIEKGSLSTKKKKAQLELEKYQKKEAQLLKTLKKYTYWESINYSGPIDSEEQKKLESKKEILEKRIELLKIKIEDSNEEYSLQLTQLTQRYSAITSPSKEQQLQFGLDTLSLKYELTYVLKDSLKSMQSAHKVLLTKIKLNTFSKEHLKRKQNEHSESVRQTELKKAESDRYLFLEGEKLRTNYLEKIKSIKNEINSIRPDVISLLWFSVGASLTNQEIQLFDSGLDYSQQVFKETDLVPSLNGSLTFYSSKEMKNNVKYFSIEGSVNYGNNQSSLKQVNVITIDSIAENRVLQNSQNAYQGDYKENVVTANIHLDYYQFLGDKDNYGFHFRIIQNIGPHIPVTSIRGGILLAAIKKDRKSVANFEVFYGLNNIFEPNREDNLLSKNVLGIQTTFPFSLNLKK